MTNPTVINTPPSVDNSFEEVVRYHELLYSNCESLSTEMRSHVAKPRLRRATRVGVYRGVGYKLGAWHDVVWWHLPLRERVADPDPPADLPSVMGPEEWDAVLLALFGAPERKLRMHQRRTQVPRSSPKVSAAADRAH